MLAATGDSGHKSSTASCTQSSPTNDAVHVDELGMTTSKPFRSQNGRSLSIGGQPLNTDVMKMIEATEGSAFIFVDTSAIIIQCNRTFEALTGRGIGKSSSLTLFDLLGELSDRSRMDEFVEKMLRGDSVSTSNVFYRPDGSHFRGHIAVTSVDEAINADNNVTNSNWNPIAGSAAVAAAIAAPAHSMESRNKASSAVAAAQFALRLEVAQVKTFDISFADHSFLDLGEFKKSVVLKAAGGVASLLKWMVEAKGEALVLTDQQGRILAANEAWEKLAGYPLSQVRGLTCGILQGPLTDRRAVSLMSAKLLRGEAAEAITTNYHSGGSAYLAQILVVPNAAVVKGEATALLDQCLQSTDGSFNQLATVAELLKRQRLGTLDPNVLLPLLADRSVALSTNDICRKISSLFGADAAAAAAESSVHIARVVPLSVPFIPWHPSNTAEVSSVMDTLSYVAKDYASRNHDECVVAYQKMGNDSASISVGAAQAQAAAEPPLPSLLEPAGAANSSDTSVVLSQLAQRMDGIESYAELYHMVEDTKDAALLLMDKEGCIRLVSTLWEEMFGRSAADVRGSKCDILYGPLTDASVMFDINSKLENGECCEAVVFTYGKDGYVCLTDIIVLADLLGGHYHLAHLRVLSPMIQPLSGCGVVTSDDNSPLPSSSAANASAVVAQQTRREKEARSSGSIEVFSHSGSVLGGFVDQREFQAKYSTKRMSDIIRELMNAATKEALLLTDKHGRVVLASKAWEMLTGYSTKDLKGQSCAALQGPLTNRRGIALMSSQLIQGHAASAVTVNYMQDKTSAYLVEVVVLPNAFKAPARVASLLEGAADVPSYLPDVCANMEKERIATATAAGAGTVATSSSTSFRRVISRGDMAAMVEGGRRSSGGGGKVRRASSGNDLASMVSNMTGGGATSDSANQGLKREEFSEYHLCRLSPLSEPFSLCDESENRSEKGGKAINRVSEKEVAEAIARVSEKVEGQYMARRKKQATAKKVTANAGNAVDSSPADDVQNDDDDDEEGDSGLQDALDKLLSDDATQLLQNVQFLSSFLTMCLFANRADAAISVAESLTGRIVHANTAWEQLTMMAFADVKGRSYWEILQGPLTDTGRTMADFDARVKAGHVAEMVTYNYRGDGKAFLAHIVVVPVFMDSSYYITKTRALSPSFTALQDSVDGSQVSPGMLRDKVHLHRSMSSLLNMMLTAEHEAFLLTDKYGRIVVANAAWERLTGYANKDIRSKTCAILQGPLTNKRAVAALDGHTRVGKAAAAVTVNYRSDKSAVVVQLVIVPNAISLPVDIYRAVKEASREGSLRLLIEAVNKAEGSPGSAEAKSPRSSGETSQEDSSPPQFMYDYHVCRVCPLSEVFLLPDGERTAPAEEAEVLRVMDSLVAQQQCLDSHEAVMKGKDKDKKGVSFGANDNVGQPTEDGSASTQTVTIAANEHERTNGSKVVDPPHRIYRSPYEQYCIVPMSKGAKKLLKVFEKARTQVDLCKIIDDNESLAIVVTDTLGRIVYANVAWERLAAKHLKAVRGSTCVFMQGELTDKRATADLNKRIRLGEFSETVLINYSGSDQAFWNHLVIAPKIFGGQYHLGILKVLGKQFQLLEAEDTFCSTAALVMNSPPPKKNTAGRSSQTSAILKAALSFIPLSSKSEGNTPSSSGLSPRSPNSPRSSDSVGAPFMTSNRRANSFRVQRAGPGNETGNGNSSNTTRPLSPSGSSLRRRPSSPSGGSPRSSFRQRPSSPSGGSPRSSFRQRPSSPSGSSFRRHGGASSGSGGGSTSSGNVSPRASFLSNGRSHSIRTPSGRNFKANDD